MTVNMNEKKLREEMCEIARMMYDKGLICGPAGNISAKLADGVFLLTPSIFFKQRLTPEQLIIVDEQGNKVGPETPANRDLQPTSETSMHMETYKNRPDIGAIVHAHPTFCVALSVAGKKIRPQVLTEAMLFLGAIGEAEYQTPTSDELGVEVGRLMQNHDCVLLPYHGVTVAAKDMWEACAKLEVLEQTAEICVLAEQLGGEKPLALPHVKDMLKLREKWGLAKPSDTNLLDY
jgi:L-fuculose-phosphate aldolase